GSVSATRITCSPKTIVVAEVEKDIVLRMIGSEPHIAAATATRTTPGMAASFRRTAVRVPRSPGHDDVSAAALEIVRSGRGDSTRTLLFVRRRSSLECSLIRRKLNGGLHTALPPFAWSPADSYHSRRPRERQA